MDGKKYMKTKIDFTDSVTYAKKGDIKAFEFLYSQSVQIFKARIMPYTRNEQDTEDILQDVYIKIFTSLDKLQDPKAFMGWGLQICVRTALDYCRKKKKQTEKEEFHPMASDDEIQGMDAMSASVLREQIDPQEQMDAAETKRLLDEMIADLPDMQRLCILLWQENYSTADISSALDLPAGTVKSNINYAKKKIKEKVLLLEKQGTKLYGLSPLPFFLWVMDLYTREYLPARPAAGSAASFAEIISHASMDAAHTFTAANTGVNGNHAAGMSHPSPSAGRPGSPEMPGSLQNASQAMGNTGPASYGPAPMQGGYIGNQAMATGTRIAAGAAGKSVMTKVIIGIVSVAVIGLGGFGTYRLVTGLHDRYVQEQEKTDAQSAGSDPSSADGSTRSEAAGDIVSEVSGLEYIGNTHYIGEQEKEIPSGYIMADFADLDSDGEEEIYAFEIHENHPLPSLSFVVYEKEENSWNMAASCEIEQNNLLSDPVSFRYKTVGFLYDHKILISSLPTTGGSHIRKTDCVLQYTKNHTITEEHKDSMADIPKDAPYIFDFQNWYISTDGYSYYYKESIETFDGTVPHEEGYAYVCIDYTHTSSHEVNGITLKYPDFYNDYVDFIDDSEQSSFRISIRPIDNLKVSPSYDFRSFEFIYENNTLDLPFEYFNDDGFKYLDSYVLLWEGTDNSLFYCAYIGDAIATYGNITAYNHRLDLCIAYNIILDTSDYILYNFSYTTDQTGTIYPTDQESGGN